ncbi:MAG: 2OG-Fe(II) oxygenase [Pseudomonadota bacterium]
MTALILENFMPKPMEDEIETVLFSPRMPWVYYPNTNTTDHDTQSGDSPQFVHGFIQDGRTASQYATIPQAILQRLGLTNDMIIRAKANIMGRELEPITNPKHIDDAASHYVMIYYVNSADGDTVLYKDDEITDRISPKKGRAVIFDGHIEHASTTPVQSRYRCILNYNLQPTIDLESLKQFETA